MLGRRLAEEGWAVRGTSRRSEGVAAVEAAGLEGAIADPNRPGTLLELVGDVTAVLWLLGSARGEPAAVAAIHGSRLERFLEKLVDTPVRGFVYEAAGSVAPAVIARGAEIVEWAGATWRIPTQVVVADPTDPAAWTDAMHAATINLLRRRAENVPIGDEIGPSAGS